MGDKEVIVLSSANEYDRVSFFSHPFLKVKLCLLMGWAVCII